MEYTTNFPKNLTHPILTKIPCIPASVSCNDECSEVFMCDELGTLMVFDVINKRISYRTPLPNGAHKVFISPKCEYIFVICMISPQHQNLYIYRVIRPFKLIEVDSIPNVANVAFLSDCSSSPIDFVALCDDNETVIRYYYGNNSNKSHEIVAQKRLPFKVTHFITNYNYSQICAASYKELVILNPDLITIKREQFQYIMAGVAFSGNDLFMLAGCSLKFIDDEKRDIFLPFGEPLVIQSHKNHLVVADGNKIYAIDSKSGKIYFYTQLPNRAFVINIFTNEDMSVFIIQLKRQPALITIVNDTAITKSTGLLKPFELKDTSIICKNIPESESSRAMAETPISVPATTYSVFVGKFNDITEEDVREVFQQNFGPVARVRPFTGHCFVDFKDGNSMSNALRKGTILVKNHEVFINVAQKNAKK